MYERGFWFFQNGLNPKAVNSFGVMVSYMGPIFVIRYAMRRRTKFQLTKSHELYTVGKLKARAIFLKFELR